MFLHLFFKNFYTPLLSDSIPDTYKLKNKGKTKRLFVHTTHHLIYIICTSTPISIKVHSFMYNLHKLHPLNTIFFFGEILHFLMFLLTKKTTVIILVKTK